MSFILHVEPAKVPPAMSHALLPAFRDQIAGNAADHYKQAVSLRKKIDPEILRIEIDFLEVLTSKRPIPQQEKLTDYLREHANVLAELRTGSRCRSCDWQLDDRIDKEGANAIDFSTTYEYRKLSTVLRVNARSLIGQGRIDEALEALQCGLALGKHVGEGPTLIVHLVGVAITNGMLEELAQVMQARGVPSLYRALARLPQPFFFCDKVIEGETRFMEVELGIRRLGRKAISPDEAKQALEKMILAELEVDLTGKRKFTAKARAGMVADLLKRMLPIARKSLTQLGFKDAELTAMNEEQIVVMDIALRMRDRVEEILNVMRAPYGEAVAAIRIAPAYEPVARPSATGDFVIGQVQQVMGVAGRMRCAGIRTDRHIAMLRIIEAIRVYTVENDGKVPEKLDAVAARVFVPIDPATGKAFEYRLKDKNTFVLSAPPFDGSAAGQHNSIEFTVTVRK